MELLEKLEHYAETDQCPMHMPGHKRRDMGGGLPWQLDITEIDGFDNLHDAQGVLKDGMDRAAGLYGSKRAFFLVGGSTCGILAGICAATRPGDTVLLPRGCHKSVYHALELRDLKPVYLPVPVDDGFGVSGSLWPETVAAALEAHPEARLVIVTSPTYEGVVSDVAAITALAHQAGVPVLVDEAHGAHLGLAPWLPAGAVAAGADLVIQSAHKTLPSLTQTALAHWSSDLVPAEEFARQLAIFETSSPSYLLMGSLDHCYALLERQGAALWEAYRKNLEAFDRRTTELRHLRLLCHGEDRTASHPDFFAFDLGKIVISTRGTDLTGPGLMDLLRQRYHIELEMAQADYALAMTSLCDTPQTLGRLADALLEIDGTLHAETERHSVPQCPLPRPRMSISAARAAEGGLLPAEQAVGRVCGEMVWAYPPGIPLLAPGEEITAQVLEALRAMAERGVALHAERSCPPRTLWAVKNTEG